jgi:pimeloyl-ACP methyl ester carboxylesterase
MSRAGRMTKLALGAAGAGLTGYTANRYIGRRIRSAALDRDDHFGSVRGTAVKVEADDGLVLHAEIDEIAPYSREPHGDRATVVFVHGFALTQDCWHFQRKAFRGKRRMIFYDQRSHGRSEVSPKENATIEQLGKDLRRVIDELSPDEPVVVVGHSMGGMTLIALAEEHPDYFGDRVVGAGLISTTGGRLRTHKVISRYVPDSLGRRAVERGLMLAAQRQRLLDLIRQRGTPVALGIVREFAFGDTDVPLSYVMFVDDMISATPLGVLVEFLPQFDLLDKFHVVRAFGRIPTLIVGGTEDKLTSIGHARKLNKHIDDSRLLELKGGGHMPILEFKDEVNDGIADLLEASENRQWAVS